jgi:hypothetical protein
MIPHIPIVLSNGKIEVVVPNYLPALLRLDLEEVIEPFKEVHNWARTSMSISDHMSFVDRHVEFWLKGQVRTGRLRYDSTKRIWMYGL